MKARAKRNAAALPETMKAAAVDRFGPPSRLKLHELPVPRPAPDEVLIALDTAGVGIWDASIRDGSWRKGRPRFPLVPGVDGAGVVVAKGSRVRRFQIGDRVYAYEFGNKQGGFYAQFAVVRAEHVARVPEGMDLREAGAAATTGLTALQGVSALSLRPGGKKLLVFGATGAVGTMAVQFAAGRRAAVIATASGKAAARLVASLGASAVIDARSTTAVDELRRLAPEGLDAVLALAGGDDLERLLDFVRPGGRVVYPNGVEPAPRKRRGLRAFSYDAEASPSQFAKLNRELIRIEARVPIAASYPLARAAEAHRRLEGGHVLGRIVLKVSQR